MKDIPEHPDDIRDRLKLARQEFKKAHDDLRNQMRSRKSSLEMGLNEEKILKAVKSINGWRSLIITLEYKVWDAEKNL